MYTSDMWLRKIQKVGDSKMVVLSPIILSVMKLEVGDYVLLQMDNKQRVVIQKANAWHMVPELLEEQIELPIIKHE